MAERHYTNTELGECHGCHWTTSGRGSRGRAAQHHDKTRHRVVVTETTTYDADRTPTPEQEELTLKCPLTMF